MIQRNGDHTLVLAHDSVIPSEQPAFPDTGEKRIRVAADVMEAKLIHAPKPEYPALAKVTKKEGVVKLAVLVGKDGRVKNLKVVSGPALLAEAAETAVSNYVYRDTLLNGVPIEVITVVEVPFRLTE